MWQDAAEVWVKLSRRWYVHGGMQFMYVNEELMLYFQ